MEIAATLIKLEGIVGRHNVLTDAATLACYSYDGFLEVHRGCAVVVPHTAQQVANVVKTLRRAEIRYVVRGSGTGYVGGAVPINGEVVILTTRLQSIREINREERYVWVEAGVLTQRLQKAVARVGLKYPPDPSSKAVSTIGGNIATNAGGPHCLGYGVTTNYVLELECVTADGELVRFGGRTALARDLDLRGLIAGSEGTMAIVTAARMRLVPIPPSGYTVFGEFSTAQAASQALCEMFRLGVQPIALDMTCGVVHPEGKAFSFPNHSMLYVETEGDAATVQDRTKRICDAIRRHGGSETVQSKGDLVAKRYEISQRRWRGITEHTPNLRYFLFDAVVRRSDLAEMLRLTESFARDYHFIVANTFHAGDGNIHPAAFFDPRDPTVAKRLDGFRDAVLNAVADLRGSLSGEHGIGIEKLHMIPTFYPPATRHLMSSLVRAFQPNALLGSGKLVASGRDDTGESCAIVPMQPEISVENGYAVVDGHTTLEQLHETLISTAYEFPYEPLGCSTQITIDDLMTQGPPSLRERKTGPARDLLLGGVLRNARGTTIPFGSLFAKDVSALDLRKIVFGSNGRLGHVERAALKLVPRERSAAFGICELPSMGEALRILRRLETSQLPFSTLYVARQQGKLHVGCIAEGVDETLLQAKAALEKIKRPLTSWSGVTSMPISTLISRPLEWSEDGALRLPAYIVSGPDDFISFSYPAITARASRQRRYPVVENPPALIKAVLEAFHAT